MFHSFAEKTNLTCPYCHQPFAYDVWLIIDTKERPDLLELAQAGILHTAICPHCHTELGQVDAPLLLYRPTQQPALIFSPAEQTSQEEDGQDFYGLLELLREQTNTDWTEDWLEANIQIVPYPTLPMQLGGVLSKDDITETALDLDTWLRGKTQIEAVFDEDDIAREMAEMRQHVSNWLQNTAQTGVQPNEDDIAGMVMGMAAAMRQTLEKSVGNTVSSTNPFIEPDEEDEPRNKQEEKVVLIQQFINQETWQQSYQFVREYPELLEDSTLEVLKILIAKTQSLGNQRTVDVLTEHLALLQASRELGLEEAFRSHLRYEELEIPPGLRSLVNEINQLNHPEEMPQKIALLEQVLSQVAQTSNPSLWATLQGMLGVSLQSNPYGDHAENLERAISHINQALKEHTRDNMPIEWAISSQNLANAYFYRIEGERADNIERAIELYKQVLQEQSRANVPVDWARNTNNLAGAYQARVRGDRGENIEQAIQLYKQALQVQTSTAMPTEWATTTTNLGVAYLVRIRGKKSQNIEQAIRLFEEALQEQNRMVMPTEWATTANNLALAYYERINGERAQDIEQAIQLYEEVLEVNTYEAMPRDWATTTINLANAYRNRIEGEQAQNIEKAIELYEQALQELTRTALPLDWAKATTNLALAYSNRIKGERTDNIEQAIHLYEQALEILSLTTVPATHQQIQQYLGDLHFGEGRWAEAIMAYQRAIEANELLLKSAVSREGQLIEVVETEDIFPRIVYALLQLGRYGEALVQLDEGKARLLAQIVEQEETNLTLLTETEQEAFASAREQFSILQAERQLPEGSAGRRPTDVLASLQEGALNHLNNIIAQLRATYPDFMPEGLDLPDLLAIIPKDGALIAPVVTSHGGGVLVVPYGVAKLTADHYLSLPELTGKRVSAWVIGTEEAPGWLRVYADFINNRLPLSALGGWKAIVSEVVIHLLAPIQAKLAALGVAHGAELLLVPQGRLGMLPLHASWVDSHIVRYAPSGYAVQAIRRRLGVKGQKSGEIEGSLLAVVNPTRNLPFAPYEGQVVAGLFAKRKKIVLNESAATHETILDQLAQHDYLHFSCHGNFGWGNVDESGLLLADEKRLTLRDILTHRLRPARLVTLSACETGLTDWKKAADEFVGLPTAFLQAGAVGVVSTLWAVDDLATSLLMEQFYRLHLAGMDPAPALRAAQICLRDVTAGELTNRFDDESQQLMTRLTEEEALAYWYRFERMDKEKRPFADPYYWAAFTFTGA